MRIVITTANRCPQGILWAPHFRADGSCHCEPRQDEEAPTRGQDEEAPTRGLRFTDHETKAFARRTRALSPRLDKR